MGYNQLTSIPAEIAKLPSLKTFKCMNNIIEIIPAAICEMDLRVLDVSSNPVVQPPLETCERGLHAMRRYYHCLKLEEMAGPDFQESTQNKSIFKKIKIRKKKDLAKKAFPSSLCRSSMFRTVSEPAHSTGSIIHTSTETLAQASLEYEGAAPLIPREQPPPLRSVSFSWSNQPGKSRYTSDSSLDTRNSLPLMDPKRTLQENYDSDDSVASDVEPFTENLQLVGLNKAERMANEITVNDTLKVIFVGMALSGKTSIIKRLIEGKDAKIPQKDERTIGVDIYEWDPKAASRTSHGSLMTQIPFDGELGSRIKGDVDVKFSVWDFAGQHVYHVSSLITIVQRCQLLPTFSSQFSQPYILHPSTTKHNPGNP